jgi:hypothetical protein
MLDPSRSADRAARSAARACVRSAVALAVARERDRAIAHRARSAARAAATLANDAARVVDLLQRADVAHAGLTLSALRSALGMTFAAAEAALREDLWTGALTRVQPTPKAKVRFRLTTNPRPATERHVTLVTDVLRASEQPLSTKALRKATRLAWPALKVALATAVKRGLVTRHVPCDAPGRRVTLWSYVVGVT